MQYQPSAREGAVGTRRAGEGQGGHEGQKTPTVHPRCSLTISALAAARTKETAPSTRAQIA